MTRQQTSLQRKRFANNHLRLRLFLVELRPRKRAVKKNQHCNESTRDARSTACGVACREGRTEARRSVCETQSGSRVTTTRQRKAKGRPKSACCKYHTRNPSLVVAKQPGRSFWCRRSCRAINMTLQQMFCQCDRSTTRHSWKDRNKVCVSKFPVPVFCLKMTLHRAEWSVFLPWLTSQCRERKLHQGSHTFSKTIVHTVSIAFQY